VLPTASNKTFWPNTGLPRFTPILFSPHSDVLLCQTDSYLHTSKPPLSGLEFIILWRVRFTNSLSAAHLLAYES